jgi:hypothetical protein
MVESKNLTLIETQYRDNQEYELFLEYLCFVINLFEVCIGPVLMYILIGVHYHMAFPTWRDSEGLNAVNFTSFLSKGKMLEVDCS